MHALSRDDGSVFVEGQTMLIPLHSLHAWRLWGE